MSKKSLVPVNMLALASAPSIGQLGDFYFNTSNNTLYAHDGTDWTVQYLNASDIADLISNAGLASTDDLSEGLQNLYYTDTRVGNYISNNHLSLQGTTGAQGTQGRQGTQGTQGPQPWTLIGEYNNGYSYTYNDAVTYQGGFYYRTGNPLNPGYPPTPGSINASWTPVADGGAQGTQGTQGLQGRQGIQGTQGTIGSTGLQGAIGTTGAQGTTGTQGSTGSTGAQGTTGTQGAIGSQGTTGTQGAIGSQGTQGIQGTQGTQGTQGIQGIQGPANLNNSHLSVSLATAAVLPNSPTYTAGSTDAAGGTGIGGYLQGTTNGALVVDGVTATSVGQRILVKDQATTTQNGIYTVTTIGTAGTKWKLTRASDYDDSSVGEITYGDFTLVVSGNTHSGQTWIQYNTGSLSGGAIKIDTDPILFTQTTGTGVQGATGATGAGGVISNYGSFYSTVDQNATTGGEAVRFDTTNIQNGVTLVTNGSYLTRLTAPVTGTYLIDFVAQLAVTGPGNKQANFWLVKNGATQVSTAFDSVVSSNSPTLTGWTWQVNATAADYYEVFWNGDSTSLYLNAVAAASPVPQAAGAVIRMSQINYQGLQGTTGTQGATGAQGTIGAQGTAGSNGSNGAQGTTGAQGATGSTGAQGTTGTTGAQGTTGTQGATGSTGLQGAIGAGAQGTQGTQGTQGIQGIQGSQGIVTSATAPSSQSVLWMDTTATAQTGPQGVQGLQGLQGASGGGGSAATSYALGTVYADTPEGYSTSLGYSANANSSAGTAIGAYSIANASAVAVGASANGYSTGYVAVGAYAQPNGINSIAIGQGAYTGNANNISIGFYATDNDYNTNAIVIGAGANAATSDSITMGNESVADFYCNVSGFTALSDARDKTNIEPLQEGLQFVNSLNPVKFEWDSRDENGKKGIADAGFIAQDLIASEDAIGAHDYLKLSNRANDDKLMANYSRLIPVLVKAVQDLSAEVDLLKAQLGQA